ncbi:MAG: hypothetical protein A3F54_00820 [Candidatus Kerfeldbacteria bacterium RIFCSPHIGHO2_12_FULL_48_17]|uniref:HTH merR-type domain-containing protein n=1 Tax=Candidatus Kerfeldbacteria bacterium RIFCSPHIGHO2_12_FULL_48_17 TaxID=1798542 RepID=A0A1G2B4I8_9BACT|nr:MAG: hypothetical protein A3F54_00820 [Candidatus Kerfeldbacteria bacterium RIFCSPHIGHO2_12_FULL_48_17]
MNPPLLSISQTAQLLGVSLQTLRRWDESGKLKPIRSTATSYRYYRQSDIDSFLQSFPKNIFRMGYTWAVSATPYEPPAIFFCPTQVVFQARLQTLFTLLTKLNSKNVDIPLLIAIIGEIGNNAFDHNLGNWPDISGLFFAYDLKKREVIIADRGQGVFTTLKRVKPSLTNDVQAVRVAFTEVISGRAPEARGNGLKFVRNVIAHNAMQLLFLSGNARLQSMGHSADLTINETKGTFHGCLAKINF